MQASDKNFVKVIGSNKEFVSYTHPARARQLVAKGRAFILLTNPYTIQLKSKHVYGESERVSKMAKSKPKYTSFTHYFKEEKDVWVQNVSKTQISLSFTTAAGQYIGKCIPRTRKPVNLSQLVSWDAIKSSTDLKMMVNRRPAKLLLLDEDEALAYYDELAKEFSTTREDEMDKAFEEQTRLMDHLVPEFSETNSKEHDLDDMDALAANPEGKDDDQDPEDVVTPRIIGLIEQTAEDTPAHEKLGARELREELETMQDELTRADFDYLLDNGSSSIQKWARRVKSEKKK